MARKKTETIKIAETKRKPRARATALAVQLPGADSIDGALLDRAVSELNQLYRTKGLETARAVAEVVIDVFFGGSLDNFKARSGSHISFAELKKRSDLQVSYQFVPSEYWILKLRTPRHRISGSATGTLDASKLLVT